jgi:5-methyltetrahydropteroyltriglutamate--homocysteine methyltransferase
MRIPIRNGDAAVAIWEDQPLLTTVVGSYPTEGLPPRRAIHRAVEDQLAAGVELISDGQVRGDMIDVFAARIPGFRQAADGRWVVEDALDQPSGPIVAPDYLLAQRIASPHATVKGVVTGPVTLALAARVGPNAPYLGPTDPTLILRLAEILAHEVAALVAAGAEVVQVDEPALGSALGRQVAAELVENALRDMAALPACPVLHVCGDVRGIVRELLALPFAALDIEGAGVDNLSAVDADELAFSEMRLAYGCIDTRSEVVEEVEVVRQRIRAAVAAIGAERLWVSPDCGLRLLSAEVARSKLSVMVQAAQDVRAGL